ncbi:MAG TPA: hypothetical protein VGN60_01740 [Devosia sp.]|jgi:hypothetical protein|nr:hypothetical protein [Devosia sp.]
MSWIVEHRDLITVLTNLGMLLIWMAYLQVFLAGYKKQKKATILIDVGGGKGLDARCLITNMSAEAVYIHTLVATIDSPDGAVACPVTEPDEAEAWQEPSDLKLWTRQGPLESGKVRDMGSMRAILDHVMGQQRSRNDAAEPKTDVHEIELQVVAVYGSEDVMVAAKRQFRLTEDGDELSLHPTTINAEQIRSRRKRKSIVRMIEQQQCP